MLGWPAGGTPQQINLPLPRLPKQSRTPRRHAELLNPDPEASGLTDEGGGGAAGGRRAVGSPAAVDTTDSRNRATVVLGAGGELVRLGAG